MRLIIIGAVAAGTSAAAKARRNDENAEIIIYDKDSFISYSGCGMPYYIGGEVEDAKELTPRNAEFFKIKYNVDVFIDHEVMAIDSENKVLEIKNLSTGDVFNDNYDKLIIATGASASLPPVKGAQQKHVFSLRNIGDMKKIKNYINQYAPKEAVIVGTGFVGMEVCENLKQIGIEVTLIARRNKVTPGFDEDVAIYIEEHLKEKGVKIIKGTTVIEIKEDRVILADTTEIAAEFVLLSTGVKPNTLLAVQAGIELGATGAIKVNERMMTNVKDIYSCGDCAQQFNAITGKPVYHPMGSTANKTGRIAGDVATGGTLSFRGILGTGIFKIFDMTAALTGLSEVEAKKEGYDVVVCHNIKPNKPEYMGGKEMIIKGIADKDTGRLLGAQIVGFEGVDKRIDVFVTAISFKAKVEDLFHLDLAYAPPFSTTKDPVMYTGMILDNAISSDRKIVTANELEEIINSSAEYQLVDARDASQYEQDHIETAASMPHGTLRNSLEKLNKEVLTITYCNKGVTGNAAQNILLNNGFNKVYNLSGGHKNYRKTKHNGHITK